MVHDGLRASILVATPARSSFNEVSDTNARSTCAASPRHWAFVPLRRRGRCGVVSRRLHSAVVTVGLDVVIVSVASTVIIHATSGQRGTSGTSTTRSAR